MAALPLFAAAVTVGQVDTFQTNLDNWFAGGLGPPNQQPPIPPFVQASGGPAGAGDAYMVVTASEANGAGSRVVAINTTQWAGNYLAAAVGSISMDLINLGQSDLTIRLLFEDPMGGPPVDEAVTTFGAFLPAQSGWQHFVFPVLGPNLTAIEGNAWAALANATLLRIVNAPSAGDAVQQIGILGVDNIASVAAVPEPSTILLCLAGLGVVTGVARKRQ